ncbi:hypothetical protein VN97_g12562 [Penicillium thymicola]|uniref:T6SS Phospholipase effector Tle1-like catalytic domain-containing protein n=1 Tax=Penicillium thymicola TaxID=293382 RepID=A0AAI9T644_PENTH|nr:hypothetical protein VN97_g12562 [Penicillium thymicola]
MRTSAKVIRHALSIDERRPRVRNELVSDPRPKEAPAQSYLRKQVLLHVRRSRCEDGQEGFRACNDESSGPGIVDPRPARQGSCDSDPSYRTKRFSVGHDVGVGHHVNDHAHGETEDTQDVEGVWFPGCHMDIGGGFRLAKNEDWPLSHVTLVWMVQEAQRAGLRFNLNKLKQFNCVEDLTHQTDSAAEHDNTGGQRIGRRESDAGDAYYESHFVHALRSASAHGKIHDGLQYHEGTPRIGVLSWRILEYLPIRRMSLEPDGA